MSIKLSPTHGLNPSILVCPICGQDTGELALFGRLKNDAEAPKYVAGHHLCPTCQSHINQGHRALIEVEEEEQCETPTRTGRIIFITNKKILPDLQQKVAYCPKTVFNNFAKIIKDE